VWPADAELIQKPGDEQSEFPVEQGVKEVD
jgi:hypothetical protein